MATTIKLKSSTSAGSAPSLSNLALRELAVNTADGYMYMRENFPFTAIVGQQEMKQALILAAIDPSIGGVLVLGDRGTGKSTIVRSLASLLPKIRAEENCPYNCPKINNQCDFCKKKKEGKVVQKTSPRCGRYSTNS